MVERPVSVVKELVENSIDAGATWITIEIKEAGLQEIKVLDNGRGMTPQDAAVATARHATSKIRQTSDLDSVATLGFRGEALAAISAVSRFTLVTKTENAVAGVRVVISGGEVKEVVPAGCPAGTQIVVRDLFYNNRPRRKFLKSPRTESAAIADLITRYALGYPEIAFRYYSGKRLNLSTPGHGDLLESATLLFGKESEGRFLKISHSEEGIALSGLISEPEFTRANRYYQSFFVNKRLIRNYLLSRSLENAYQGLVTSGHYPCAVLFLTIAPQATDVNVHPTKSDIRFSDPQLVARVLYHGVRNALSGFLQQYRKPDFLANTQVQASWSKEPIHFQESAGQFTAAQPSTEAVGEEKGFYEMPETFDRTQTQPESGRVFFREMRILGQVLGTYLIAEYGEAVYIIDQHAAHERVRYEEIVENIKRNKSLAQKTCSQMIELTPEEDIIYVENRDLLKKIGYVLEENENRKYLVISVPWGQHTNPEPVFKELLDLLRQAEIEGKPLEIDKKTAAMLACKSAIKAGDSLSGEEMTHLLEQLDAIAHPDRCPHGRPTYIKITKSDLARWFHR